MEYGFAERRLETLRVSVYESSSHEDEDGAEGETETEAEDEAEGG